jgi:hypothetical protein
VVKLDDEAPAELRGVYCGNSCRKVTVYALPWRSPTIGPGMLRLGDTAQPETKHWRIFG